MSVLRILFLFLLGMFLQPAMPLNARVVVGAEQTCDYFPLLEGHRIAVFSNHTGRVGDEQ